ncbi:probable alpha-amylase 2, partial [Carica papaya]|uniref:probable alpha-amylase 2 n=1 Tax=Carica papaya TaxID=3649 RepID=UPI000B8C7E69
IFSLGNLLDAHRQRIVNWINATGGTSSAFDVTTKGILHSALHNQYWRLIDPQGKPTGVMGWWPSRAVTFLENHDTGSTQITSILLLICSKPSADLHITIVYNYKIFNLRC